MAKETSKKSTLAADKDDKKKPLTPAEQAKLHMDAHKKHHLNYENTDEYTISTGSLKMDIITGGVKPGFTRLVGINSGGKTSEGLELMRQFFITKPKGRAMFVKAEGRLSQEIRDRSGIKFVFSPMEWVDGTCLVYECNIYESVASFMMTLILENPLKTNYFFMIDSLDGLILESDLEKTIAEAYKVAGPAVIAKKLFQRVGIRIGKFGHILVATSQITAQPKIDPKAKTEYRAYESGGGNALKHYADNVWEYLPRFKDDKILANPKANYDQNKNPIIGHLAKVIIRKSSNEKNDVNLNYPIKYGRSNGTSIWTERELGDIISMYFVDVKGSWFTFKEGFYSEIEAIEPKAPKQIQGLDQLYDFLENNKEIAKYCFDKFRKTLTQEKIWDGEADPLEKDEKDEEEE